MVVISVIVDGRDGLGGATVVVVVGGGGLYGVVTGRTGGVIGWPGTMISIPLFPPDP